MTDLEKEGIALVKQYGFLLRMNPPIREFLRRVATRLEWREFASYL